MENPGDPVETAVNSGQRQQDGNPGDGQVTERNIGESEQLQLEDIPKDTYHVEEVNPESVDQVYNYLQFTRQQLDLTIVRAAGTKINDEPTSVKKNLKLRIKLYIQRVKYIEILSGRGENCIECYYDIEQNVVWRYTSKATPEPTQEIAAREPTCQSDNGETEGPGFFSRCLEKMMFITRFVATATQLITAFSNLRTVVVSAYTWISRFVPQFFAT